MDINTYCIEGDLVFRISTKLNSNEKEVEMYIVSEVKRKGMLTTEVLLRNINKNETVFLDFLQNSSTKDFVNVNCCAFVKQKEIGNNIYRNKYFLHKIFKELSTGEIMLNLVSIYANLEERETILLKNLQDSEYNILEYKEYRTEFNLPWAIKYYYKKIKTWFKNYTGAIIFGIIMLLMAYFIWWINH